MEAWSRFRTSFSSLPTTTSTSSSTPSSSASLCPPLLLDLADEYWFYRSVLPLPSFSLPCLPALFSTTPPPDPSTLLAQLMSTSLNSSRCLPVSSIASSSPTPPDSEPQAHLSFWDLSGRDGYSDLSDRQETYGATLCPYGENGYRDENETYFGGYSSLSDSDGDGYAYHGYRRGNAGDDEDTYHYYTADSDWEDEDAYNGYHVPSDCEADIMKEDLQLADPPHLHADIKPDDALSGIYDVGVLLKDQHEKRTREASYPPSMESKAAPLRASTARPHIQLLSLNEQGDIKESIKLWAHAVASTLPWKAAAQARPFL